MKKRALWPEHLFRVLCLAGLVVPLGLLLMLLGQVVVQGVGRLDLAFLSGYPSRRASSAGILPAIVGSLYLMGVTAALALPIGTGAAIYLEEYGRRNKLASFIELNIANLAGVPSIIYGLLGLGLFVRGFAMGRSVLAGGCTLALLVLPVVIMSAREALRTVPESAREAGYALGATKWETIRQIVLPMAAPGILTGAILSLARAIGETAPLIVVGALTYVTFLPDGLQSPFTALPIQIFNWVSRPQPEFLVNAAAGIVVLMVAMLLVNAFAIVLRNRLQRRL